MSGDTSYLGSVQSWFNTPLKPLNNTQLNGTLPTPKGSLRAYIQKIMYYFLVLTSPDKVFHNVEELHTYLDKTFYSYMMISEVGEAGDNPHINVIVKETKRLDNVKRAIKKIYYGKDLERFEASSGFLKFGAVGKVIKNEIQLKHISVYLTKEEEPEFFFWKILDIIDLCKDEPTYQEHKAINNTSTHCNLSMDKLLDLSMEIYAKEYLKLGLNTFILEELPPPTMIDFKEVLKIMSKNKINCMPIYNKLQAFYIQFMAQLGNHEYIDLLIDRLDEKLRKRIDL